MSHTPPRGKHRRSTRLSLKLRKHRMASRHGTVSRRQFGQAALASSALLATGTTRADTVDKQGWIDAHVHVWTPDTDRYPLDKNFTAAAMQPPSFTPEQLFAHSRPEGVQRIVLIQMSFYRFDNSYMLDMMALHPDVFSGVGIVDHHRDDLAKQIKQLRKQGVRGLRIHPKAGEAATWKSDEGMQKLWKVAHKNGVAVCPLINPTDLPHVETMCRRFPETTVVIDHFARVGISGTVEKDHLTRLCELARFPKVHVKTSAFYALGEKQPPYDDLLSMIRRVVDAYGPQRLMWASDCPYQVQGEHTYAASIGLIRDRADFLSEEDKQWMLRGTAEKVFFG